VSNKRPTAALLSIFGVANSAFRGAWSLG